MIGPDDPVLVLNTGSGLKDTRAAMPAVRRSAGDRANLDGLKALSGFTFRVK